MDFEKIKNFFTKEDPPDSGTVNKEQFIFNRFLSMEPSSFFEAQQANEFSSKVPSWAIACYLHHSVPKERPAPFISYIKKEKNIDGKDKEVLQKISELFCCNYDHAFQILHILRAYDMKPEEALGINKRRK